MKRFLRLVSLTLLIMSTSGNTFAEEKVNAAKQGTIRGRIVDTSKQILPGASIYIEKLHTGVTSDVNGYYTFANLTPGTYTVKVSYVGYSPVEMKITIPAGKTLEKDEREWYLRNSNIVNMKRKLSQEEETTISKWLGAGKEPVNGEC